MTALAPRRTCASAGGLHLSSLREKPAPSYEEAGSNLAEGTELRRWPIENQCGSQIEAPN